MQKRVVLLIGNHVTATTRAWALNPGIGKVKGFLFLFISTVKGKRDHIRPSRGKKSKVDGRQQSLLFQGCFVGGWGAECFSACQVQGQQRPVPASCFWCSPFRAELWGANGYQAYSNSRTLLSLERGQEQTTWALPPWTTAAPAAVWWIALPPGEWGAARPDPYYPGSISGLTF